MKSLLTIYFFTCGNEDNFTYVLYVDLLVITGMKSEYVVPIECVRNESI